MSKITQFDRHTLQIVKSEMEKALAAVAERHGVKIEIRGGKFDDVSYIPKVVVSTIGNDGVAVTPEATAFNRLAHFYGLKASDLRRKFRRGGRVYTVAGLRDRARKNPIICECDDGKRYVFPAEDVAIYLERFPV